MAYSDSIKLNMSSPEEIGRAIQKRRRAQKITQKEFAQRLGKSERTIQKYESGEILMKIDVVKQIANELNVPWQELLSSEDTNISEDNTTSEYPACKFNTRMSSQLPKRERANEKFRFQTFCVTS